MKRIVLLFATSSLVAVAFGCGSPIHRNEAVSRPESQTKPNVTMVQAKADFGPWWKAVTVKTEVEGDPQASGTALAKFFCEWTDGLGAGVVYPKKFIDTKTKKEVKMDFLWDNGGKIPAGVYDVEVEQDGVLGKGWLRTVALTSKGSIRVTVLMNAAMFDLDLNKYSEVVVYPPGTYSKYKERGMLDSIPDKLNIARYNSENRGAAGLAPSGKFDLHVKMADGTDKWLQNYDIKGNRKIKELK